MFSQYLIKRSYFENSCCKEKYVRDFKSFIARNILIKRLNKKLIFKKNLKTFLVIIVDFRQILLKQFE